MKLNKRSNRLVWGILYVCSVITTIFSSNFVVLGDTTYSSYAEEYSQETIAINNKKSQSLFGLFYGMERDVNGQFTDAVLDSIPGLLHREYSDLWCSHSDSIQFEMSLGIYLDSILPSSPVIRTELLELMDSEIVRTFEYDAPDTDISRYVKDTSTQPTAEKYLDKWQNIFHRISREYSCGELGGAYPEVIGSRNCVVCHKIYENEQWVTYILERSFDYHSTNGCPSYANYYSFRKATKDEKPERRPHDVLFTIEDIGENISHKTLENLLYAEYCRAAAAKGTTPNDYTGKQLLEKADGVAIISEGVIFYYRPYSIGSGAEGQYNLIINL